MAPQLSPECGRTTSVESERRPLGRREPIDQLTSNPPASVLEQQEFVAAKRSEKNATAKEMRRVNEWKISSQHEGSNTNESKNKGEGKTRTGRRANLVSPQRRNEHHEKARLHHGQQNGAGEDRVERQRQHRVDGERGENRRKQRVVAGSRRDAVDHQQQNRA